MATQAGWFPDPDDGSLERYWDGQVWTDERRPVAPSAAPAAGPGNVIPETSTLAIIALVAAFFVPVIGLILGYVARKDIRNSQGTKTGDGLALAAIVIGWLVVAIVAVIVVIPLVVFLIGGRTQSVFESTQESIGLVLGLF